VEKKAALSAIRQAQNVLIGPTRLRWNPSTFKDYRAGLEPNAVDLARPPPCNTVELATEVGRNKPAPAGVSGKLTGQMPETVVTRPYSGLRQTLNSTALGSKPA